MTPIFRTLLAPVTALLLFSACGEKDLPPASLDIYFTADTSGRIEPCGCFTGQYGGLTRVSTFLREKAPTDSIRVEIGNAIAGTADYEILQYSHVLQASHAIGYHAVNLGAREASLPADALRDLAKNSPVPLVSANVLDAATREPLVQPFVIVKHGDLNVGIIGVVDPDSLKTDADGSVEVAGITETLRKVVPQVKPECDVLICLAFADDTALESIARDFYEFAVVLGGDVRQPYSTPVAVNRSQILATTNQARALGEFHAMVDRKSGQLSEPKGTVTLMVDNIKEDPAIRQYSTDYRAAVAKTVLAIDNPDGDIENRVPGVKPPATYLGSESCAGCHPKAFDVWAKSGHGHAFESLNYRDSKMDPSCVKCHVVGFGEPGGYLRSMAEEKRLINVGCESCHGPGSEHVKVRSTASPTEEVLLKMRPVGSGQCTQCHHGEFSRPFEWEEFWPQIQHGKESEMK